ncbi:MAG TPA: choice-of-anchor tandem repeat GloVer-containing protein [Rhizomicrobium sp.]
MIAGAGSRAAVAAFAVTLAAAALAMPSAEAQTYKVLHTFMPGRDGREPSASLFLHRDEIFGTTYAGGGRYDGGTVFSIDKVGTETVLHSFRGWGGVHDGGGVGLPGTLVHDRAGNLYGTTYEGGASGNGVVFKLDLAGRETVLHNFLGTDGSNPYAGLIGDAARNPYGTTGYGGESNCGSLYNNEGCGTVFKMDQTGRETLLYSFKFGADGAQPYGSLIRDAAGNLYGTTTGGGNYNCPTGCGIVFKVDPNGVETEPYVFTGGRDGAIPFGGVALDAAGNLYGTTSAGGAYSEWGTVFRLDASGHETVLYNFTGGADGGGPFSGLTRDVAGNLYGTTEFGGDLSCHLFGAQGCGIVFKLDTAGKETVLHAFTGRSDGATPMGGLIVDSAGNLYGTASERGDLSCDVRHIGCGVVFEITP